MVRSEQFRMTFYHYDDVALDPALMSTGNIRNWKFRKDVTFDLFLLPACILIFAKPLPGASVWQPPHQIFA